MKESYSEGEADKTMNIFDNLDLSMAQPEEQPPVQEAQEAATKEPEVKEPEQKVQEEPKANILETEKEVEVSASTEVPAKSEQEPEEKEEKKEEVKEEEKEVSKEELLDLVKKQEKLIGELQEDIKYLKSKLDKERGIKESLELEILQFKQMNKLHLAEQIVDLRKELGLKEEAIDDLMMLSEESLNSSIKTFMEFKESNTFNVNKLPKIDSPALVSDKEDNTTKEVQESVNNKNLSNIDYEEDIDDWFKKMTHRKYFN